MPPGRTRQINAVQLDVTRSDLRRDSLPSLQGTTVLANLLRPLLLELSERIEQAPDHLVISGLLRQETDEVVQALALQHGFFERLRLSEGEWAASWLSTQPVH